MNQEEKSRMEARLEYLEPLIFPYANEIKSIKLALSRDRVDQLELMDSRSQNRVTDRTNWRG